MIYPNLNLQPHKITRSFLLKNLITHNKTLSIAASKQIADRGATSEAVASHAKAFHKHYRRILDYLQTLMLDENKYMLGNNDWHIKRKWNALALLRIISADIVDLIPDSTTIINCTTRQTRSMLDSFVNISPDEIDFDELKSGRFCDRIMDCDDVITSISIILDHMSENEIRDFIQYNNSHIVNSTLCGLLSVIIANPALFSKMETRFPAQYLNMRYKVTSKILTIMDPQYIEIIRENFHNSHKTSAETQHYYLCVKEIIKESFGLDPQNAIIGHMLGLINGDNKICVPLPAKSCNLAARRNYAILLSKIISEQPKNISTDNLDDLLSNNSTTFGDMIQIISADIQQAPLNTDSTIRSEDANEFLNFLEKLKEMLVLNYKNTRQVYVSILKFIEDFIKNTKMPNQVHAAQLLEFQKSLLKVVRDCDIFNIIQYVNVALQSSDGAKQILELFRYAERTNTMLPGEIELFENKCPNIKGALNLSTAYNIALVKMQFESALRIMLDTGDFVNVNWETLKNITKTSSALITKYAHAGESYATIVINLRTLHVISMKYLISFDNIYPIIQKESILRECKIFDENQPQNPDEDPLYQMLQYLAIKHIDHYELGAQYALNKLSKRTKFSDEHIVELEQITKALPKTTSAYEKKAGRRENILNIFMMNLVRASCIYDEICTTSIKKRMQNIYQKISERNTEKDSSTQRKIMKIILDKIECYFPDYITDLPQNLDKDANKDKSTEQALANSPIVESKSTEQALANSPIVESKSTEQALANSLIVESKSEKQTSKKVTFYSPVVTKEFSVTISDYVSANGTIPNMTPNNTTQKRKKNTQKKRVKNDKNPTETKRTSNKIKNFALHLSGALSVIAPMMLFPVNSWAVIVGIVIFAIIEIGIPGAPYIYNTLKKVAHNEYCADQNLRPKESSQKRDAEISVDKEISKNKPSDFLGETSVTSVYYNTKRGVTENLAI